MSDYVTEAIENALQQIDNELEYFEDRVRFTKESYEEAERNYTDLLARKKALEEELAQRDA